MYKLFVTNPVGWISINLFPVYLDNGIVMKVKLGLSLVYVFNVFE